MKKIAILCVVLLAVPVALAAISVGGACSDGGSVADVDLRLESIESDTEMPVYAELQGVTLAADLDVDITTTGLFDQFADLTPGTISSGTVVNSYIVHFDRAIDSGPLTALEGSVTVDAPILGVIVRSDSLAASDDAVRATGTSYEHDAPLSNLEHVRGLELNGPGVQDEITIVDAYTVSFHLETGEAMDEIRIITCVWIDETAWADGTRYVSKGNWATYTAYISEVKSETLYAGQDMDAGTVDFSAPDGGTGDVTITITLNEGWRFADVEENVKVQDYDAAPTEKPKPGQFDWKDDATGSSCDIVVPANSYYGVHVDVEWLDCGDE